MSTTAAAAVPGGHHVTPATSPGAAPLPAQTAPGAPAPAPAPAPNPQQRRRSTPAQLRILLVLSVVASILIGVFGMQAGSLQANAAGEARRQAAQLVAVQEVRNALVSADAIASNAFLVGGLEPIAQRADYDDTIATVSQQIANLSGSESADAAGLAKVSDALTRYTGLVEQARANNRQGFPVGSAYLDQASTLLRGEMLSELNTLVKNGADRVASAFAALQNALFLLVGAALALVLLILCQVWLARKTRRYLNRPLVTGTAILTLLGIVATVLFFVTASQASSVRQNSYAATLAVSQALTSATDAKSQESFTLIKRGSGASIEAGVQTSIAQARTRLEYAVGEGTVDQSLLDQLNAWSAQHDAIRQLDVGGNWDAAVEAATKTGDGTANAAFDTFKKAADTAITADAKATENTLSGYGITTSILCWLLLAAGLVGAAFAWRGVSLRLEEYR
ncbi:hypothetical protein HQQ81_16055 [Microbacteriaceae bacterium VKM Ac-2854]|nr:hypothetical protein [Microbacteriaceae bacterium VKM Ac-2854]